MVHPRTTHNGAKRAQRFPKLWRFLLGCPPLNKTLSALAASAAIAASITAPIAIPGAAFAQRTTSQSEQQRGYYSQPYACSVQSSDLQLFPDGASTQAVVNEESSTYTQNDNTTYSLSQVSITAPRNDTSGLTSVITVRDASRGVIVRANQATANESGYRTVNGIEGATGTVGYLLQTSRPVFRAGDYEIRSTLTCAQAL